MTNPIHEKINNLLKMAEGKANGPEAKAAMAMASKLMMKHGIEEADINRGDAKAKIIESDKYSIKVVWHHFIIQGVANLYGVRTLSHPKMKHAWFIGRPVNVQAAEDTLVYILLQIEQLYKDAMPKGMTQQQRARYRKDFKNAAALEVHTKCHEIVMEQSQANTESTDCTALVITEHRSVLNQEAADHIAETYGRLRSGRSRNISYRDPAAVAAGAAAGRQVDINRRVK